MTEWHNNQKHAFIEELLDNLDDYDKYLSMNRLVVREWAEKLYDDIKDLFPSKLQYVPNVLNGFYSPMINRMSEVHSYILSKIGSSSIWIDDVGRFAFLMNNIGKNMRWYMNQCQIENSLISKRIIEKLSTISEKEEFTSSELEFLITTIVKELRITEEYREKYVEFTESVYELNKFLKKELTGKTFKEFKRRG